MRNLGKAKGLLEEAKTSKDWESYWNNVDKAVNEIGYDTEEERHNLEGALVQNLNRKKK
jgi:hypothetical protein